VLGLAAATAQTTAKMVNKSMTTSGSQHSSSFTHTAKSSHEGEINKSNRYGLILASEGKKGLSLDAKFEESSHLYQQVVGSQLRSLLEPRPP
jgi:hypothetical protein